MTRHYDLAKFLTERGHKVTVIASDVNYLSGEKLAISNSENIYEGIIIKRVRTLGKLHAGFLYRLFNFLSFMLNSLFVALNVRNIDLVFDSSPPIFHGLTALIVAKIKRVPFVFEVRDIWPDAMVEIGAVRSPFLIIPARFFESFLYSKAKIIIVNSPGYLPILLNKGVEEKKIRVVVNGIDTLMFNPNLDGNALRGEYHIKEKFVVMYTGAIGRSNDIRTLLHVAQNLREMEDITFLIVGGGNERDEMVHMSKEMGLDNVLFIPPQPKARIPDILAAADLTIAILRDVPTFRTTYPNKVLDYMAMAKPVILAIDGVIRNTVEEAGAGIFVRPGDPEDIAKGIVKLFRDSNLRNIMGKNGRRFVEQNLDMNRLTLKFEEVIIEALSS